jgi:hypothetical protein
MISLAFISPENLGNFVVSILAVLGAAVVGALLGGWGINLSAKLIARRKAPRPIVLTIRALGAVACGLAVWLWLFGSGGAGWGRGGGGVGLGPGGSGADAESNSTAAKPRADNSDAPEVKNGADRTLRIEVLGDPRVESGHFYRPEGDQRLYTITELSQLVKDRRREHSSLNQLEVIIYKDSPAKDHQAVSAVERLAKENDMTVHLTFPTRNAP